MSAVLKADARVLHVSDALSLPLAYVTQRSAVLAMSGAGKSNLCVVLAEEMSRHGVPWVAIDPKGDWWGVRAAANGKGRGLDVPILGGEHGDLPLSPRAGARMAELVAGGKLQGVFDVSGFDPEELSSFLIDFGEVLLARLRTPLHIFCEECSDYLPQPGIGGSLDKLARRCLNVWKKLSTRIRFRGGGYTLISQRAAMVNKSALYQCETLIAMRVVGEHDKKTVKTWIEQQADATEVMKTLALLGDGEAWVCSPQKLRVMERVRFRRRTTFDSGRTPEIGEALVAPALSKIDVAALRAEMEALDAPIVLGRTDDDDPPPSSRPNGLAQQLAEMRFQVAELERELAAAREQTVGSRLSADDHTALAILTGKSEVLEQLTKSAWEAGLELLDLSRRFQRSLEHAVAPGEVATSSHSQPESRPPRREAREPAGETGGRLDPKSAQARPATKVSGAGNGASHGLGKGQVSVLTAIAQHRDGVTREQLTVLTGYKRSSRDTYLQHLRSADLTEEKGGRILATAAGRKALGSDWRPLPTGAALRKHWLERLPQGERAILELLVAAHPKWVSRDRLSEATGYKRSSRDTYVQKLRARRLAVDAERGGVKAADELF